MIARLAALLVLSLAVASAGCGRDPVLDLVDFARHQTDQVTTRWVPAGSELLPRLASDGWRIEEGEAPVLHMTRDRARLWFFSTDGETSAVDLHLAGDPPGEGPPSTISYRLNDRPRKAIKWRPDSSVLSLPFAPQAARVGWNALDLQLHGAGREGPKERPRLGGLRFVDGAERGNESPRALEIEDGELRMPGESLLEAVFEVPTRARLSIEATGELGDRSSGRMRLLASLLGPAGAVREIGTLELGPGETDELSVDLSDQEGSPAALSLRVDGPRSGALRLHRAEIQGASEPRSVEVPIRPAAGGESSRLGRPDVFVIVLDAARADAFGTYGADHPTPAVDTLAERGTRFEQALAPSSWTGQSMPALLTGFFPDTLHTERWGDPLPDSVPNVGELMSAAGYRTVLWSQHPIYSRAPSLVRGFEQVRYSGRRKRSRTPPLRLLVGRDRPTFALIHLLPPHSPYTPPAPFRGAYTSDYTGRLSVRIGSLAQLGRKRLQGLTPEEHAYIRGRYLETVAFADSLVGRIVDSLRSAGRYDDSLIVVTSDHGEAFFEHGRFMHSRELYREFLHVPMVVKWPAQIENPSRAVAAPVSLIDLLPTLADGLGLEAPGGFQGRTLLPSVLDGAPLERAVYATTRGLGDVTKPGRPRDMLQQGSWKVIHAPVAGRVELYDIETDPGETRDLAAERPALARLMLQRLLLQKHFNRGLLRLGPRADVELDPEMVKELKALGYL